MACPVVVLHRAASAIAKQTQQPHLRSAQHRLKSRVNQADPHKSAMELFTAPGIRGVRPLVTGPTIRTLRGVTSMSLGTILVILLVLALFGALPRWSYSTSWGYGPSGLVGTILVVVVVLLLLGRI